VKRAANIAFALLFALSAFAEQTTPPVPGAPRAANIPTPTDKTLANGLRVIVIPKAGIPLIAARLMIKTGGEADPADQAGLADMTASLLTKGTKTKSAEEIARGVEALGATIESGAGWDNSYVAISSLSNHFAEAMTFVADVVRNPTFKADEVERLREQNVDALSVALKDPAQLSRFVANRVNYGGGPYGHNLGGTPKSLEKITGAEATKFHATWYRPDNAIFVVAGDVKPDDAIAIAEKSFGDWSAAAGSLPASAGAGASPSDAKPRVVVVDMPDAGQAAVLVTRRGLARSDPAYIASQVTNAVLGAGYSSRLNEEVRIKRGLSYGAGSSFDFRREAGPFIASAQTKNESAGEVATIINEQLSAMTSTSVPESELTPRKAVLVGNFGRALETQAGLVARIGSLALYGLPLTDLSHYLADVQAVSAAEVQKFAASHFPDENVVIVGDVKKFGDDFKKRFPNAEIIPLAQLDLDSPTLRKP